MATKRFFDEPDTNPDQPKEKRIKTRPTFASVIEEVVTVNFLRDFCSALEPMLRRVVNTELEDGLMRRGARTLIRSSSLRIQAPEPSNLQLIFKKSLLLPIFTGSKIVGNESNPLQILLVDPRNDFPKSPSCPIKVQIVVLDGDFPSGNHETWTSEEFEKNIVKERTGKRPLLTGDLNVTMRDGVAPIGDIEFTDNSSWIRSRTFRLGVRVVQGAGHGVTIREAITESFVVKDHRGELYKKHYPPRLEDEVWRLEKIGKDGAFHKKLASEGIFTVQDFLKLSAVNPSKLRRILGIGMSEKMWEVTLKHAWTCNITGSKLYISRGPNYTLYLNPICQVVRAVINGQKYHTQELASVNRAYIENLARDAYANWNNLEEVDEVDGVMNEAALLTQGDFVDQYPNQHQTMARSYQHHTFLTDGSLEVAPMPSNANMECNDWVASSAYICTPIDSRVRYNFSDSSSDGDLTPARSFIHEN